MKRPQTYLAALLSAAFATSCGPEASVNNDSQTAGKMIQNCPASTAERQLWMGAGGLLADWGPMAKKLMNHYMDCPDEETTAFTLSQTETKEIMKFPFFLTSLKEQAASLKKGESKDVAGSFSSYAALPNTLGRYEQNYKGILNRNGDKISFSGNYWVGELYDFNPSDRPFYNEIPVRLADLTLTGNPFRVESSSNNLDIEELFIILPHLVTGGVLAESAGDEILMSSPFEEIFGVCDLEDVADFEGLACLSDSNVEAEFNRAAEESGLEW